ncbi:bZIP transcription factor 60 [Mercurialis annua]|uniref:bZIP transcription factor 60 n=1 Tax=Mercurialis annua TaxID=3986 RepID=UPI002160DD02|nr:bZIP transcription factor 60 [Mercurialis annua]
MGDTEDDIFKQVNFDDLGEIDWGCIFDELPSLATESSSSPEDVLTSSSDSLSTWIGQVESMLMNDNDNLEAADAEPPNQNCDEFLADLSVADDAHVALLHKDSSVSDGPYETDKEGEKIVDDGKVDNDSEDPDGPISKKLRRQLRNRDAAVRSRERKKMYVKDLEMKSRYMEGECRRLGRLLQCVIAENQALRLGLHSGNAYGVTSTKQESAVLLLESLLLGSLLWLVGIMCLFTLPTVPQLTLGVLVPENVEKKRLERGAGSKMFMQSLLKSRKCKASRTRMKEGSLSLKSC